MNTCTHATHAQTAGARSDFWPRSRFRQGQFGRLFRFLPPLDPPGTKQELRTLLAAVRSERPVAEGASEPTSDIPAGYTYFGQFVAHDMTFNPVSDLSRRRDPEGIVNFRTPALDLDSLYGRGPVDTPYLYTPSDENRPAGRLAVGWGMGDGEEDLPRTSGTPAVALIGDPRNDEHTILSQLHLAFIKLHNRFFDYFVAGGVDSPFNFAQQMTCWHYQRIILDDYLPRICDESVLAEIWPKDQHTSGQMPTLRWFKHKNEPFIPLEFSGAAFRFGHSMVRQAYRLNFAHLDPISTFGQTSQGNLMGFDRLKPLWSVQWDLFLDFPTAIQAQRSGLIDLRLSPSLAKLPPQVVGGRAKAGGAKPLSNLAQRNIERGFLLSLPSGQDVARAMGEKPLPRMQKSRTDDPLWIYVLREAQEQQGGKRLGRVGSRIVAETIAGLIAGDRLSFLSNEPKWKPMTVKIPGEGDVELRDLRTLIHAAEMPVGKADLLRKGAFSPQAIYDPRVPIAVSLHQAEVAAAARPPLAPPAMLRPPMP